MREIHADTIRDTVRALFLSAAYDLPRSIRALSEDARAREESPRGRWVMDQLLENYDIAARERVPICQDTGMAVLFADVGQEVHVTGGGLEDAVHEGVRRAYREGFLRASVVSEPLFDRVNTGDNTPAVIHARIVPGEHVRLIAVPKGFGSENMSRLYMLTPAQGVKGVLNAITDAMEKAGPNPCPPVVMGVCVGGTMEQAALMAKRALARPEGFRHEDARYEALEKEALARVNALGIGPGGLGGRCTALAVHIEHLPTHIAGMPVAVNMCCHAARHAEATI